MRGSGGALSNRRYRTLLDGVAVTGTDFSILGHVVIPEAMSCLLISLPGFLVGGGELPGSEKASGLQQTFRCLPTSGRLSACQNSCRTNPKFDMLNWSEDRANQRRRCCLGWLAKYQLRDCMTLQYH